MLVGIASGFATSLVCLGILIWTRTWHPPEHKSSTGIGIVARSWSGRSITCERKRPHQHLWSTIKLGRKGSIKHNQKQVHLTAFETSAFHCEHQKKSDSPWMTANTAAMLGYLESRIWSYQIETHSAAEDASYLLLDTKSAPPHHKCPGIVVNVFNQILHRISHFHRLRSSFYQFHINVWMPRPVNAYEKLCFIQIWPRNHGQQKCPQKSPHKTRKNSVNVHCAHEFCKLWGLTMSSLKLENLRVNMISDQRDYVMTNAIKNESKCLK